MLTLGDSLCDVTLKIVEQRHHKIIIVTERAEVWRHVSFYLVVAVCFLVKMLICLCFLNISCKDGASYGLLFWWRPLYMLFLIVESTRVFHWRNAAYNQLANDRIWQITLKSQGFQVHISPCRKCMRNLCYFLSSITVKRVEYFEYFLMRKGPNLCVSVQHLHQKREMTLCRGIVCLILFWHLSQKLQVERSLSQRGLCQASQCAVLSRWLFTNTAPRTLLRNKLSWRSQYQEWKCPLKQKWSVWNVEQNR